MKRSALEDTLKDKTAKQVEAFVAWKQEAGVHTFEEIEKRAMAVGKEIMQAMLRFGVENEAWVERHERQKPEAVCERWGRKLRHGGRRRKRLTSRMGQVEWQRDYYHCAKCKAGVFPPG